jgi:hypothetical protein
MLDHVSEHITPHTTTRGALSEIYKNKNKNKNKNKTKNPQLPKITNYRLHGALAYQAFSHCSFERSNHPFCGRWTEASQTVIG